MREEMSRWEKYHFLKIQARELLNSINKTNTNLEHVNAEINELAIEIALKENLLKDIEWTIEDTLKYRPGPGNSKVVVCLSTTAERGHPAYDKLSELFETTHHCRTWITMYARVCWDDSELRMLFDSFEDLKKFCLEYGIKLSIKPLRKMQSQIDELVKVKQKRHKEIEDFIASISDITDEPSSVKKLFKD